MNNPLMQLLQQQQQFLAARNWDKALQVTNKILQLAPNEKYLTQRGYIFIEQKQYQFAARDFMKALEIAPNFEGAKNGLHHVKSLASKSVTKTSEKKQDLGENKTFGRYRILKELGRGGMGVVFHAYDPQLDREIALKVIIAGKQAGNMAIERFLQEAKATAKLQHPNIVKLYDIGVQQENHYFTMDYIKGQSLSQFIMQQKISFEEIMKIFLQICQGMEEAHHHRIIHRDLKPSNIMMSEDSRPVIMDFGLAKFIEGDKNLSKSGGILGTPAYMPPEQAQGHLKAINDTSDVYSLGGILYYMLVHAAPFKGETTWNIIAQVINKEPTKPRTLKKNIPSEIETICLKCLEKDQKRRYQSTKYLVDDIQRYLDNKPILAKPANFVQKTTKWLQRNRKLSVVLIISFICLMLLAIGLNKYYENIETQLISQQEQQELKNQQDFIREALEYKNKQNYGAAFQNVQIVLSRNPDNMEAKQTLEKLQQEVTREMQNAQQLIDENATSIHTWKKAEKIYMKILFDWKVENREYFEQLENIRKKIIDHRNNARIPYEDANSISHSLKLRKEQLENCLDLLSKAIEIDDTFFEAYFERGQVYQRLFEMEKAKQDYKSVLNIAPNYSAARYYLNSLEFSVDHLKKDNPNKNHFEWMNEALFAIEQNTLEDRKKALEICHNVIKIRPSFPDAYYLRAALQSYYFSEYHQGGVSGTFKTEVVEYQELRNLDKALQDLTEYQSLKPLSPMGYFLKGFIYTRIGSFVEAEKQLDEFYRLVNDSTMKPGGKVAGMLCYFSAIMAQGKYQKALTIFSDDSVVDFESHQEKIWYASPWYTWKGFAYMFVEDYDQALLFLNKAIAVDPNLETPSIAQMAKALILLHLGKDKEVDSLMEDIATKANQIKEDVSMIQFLSGNPNLTELLDYFPDYFLLDPTAKETLVHLKVLHETSKQRSYGVVFLGPTESMVFRLLPQWTKNKKGIQQKFNSLLAKKLKQQINISFLFSLAATLIELQSLDLLLQIPELDSYEFYYQRALLHHIEKQNDKSISDLKKSILKKPDSMEAHYALATLLAQNKEEQNNALYHLWVARELGWNNVKYTLKDKAFSSLKQHKKFRYIINNAAIQSNDLQNLKKRHDLLFDRSQDSFILKTIVKAKINK